MVDVSDQDPEHDQQYPAHPERARLYAQAHRSSNGAACVLLVVIQTDDGWAIHGMDSRGRGPRDLRPRAGTGVHVSNDSMFPLAKSIVDRSSS